MRVKITMRTEAAIREHLEHWRGRLKGFEDIGVNDDYLNKEEVSLVVESYISARAIVAVLEWCLRESADTT